MRVLVVEDDAETRSLLERGLKEQLFRVDCVSEGLAAEATAQAGVFDAIILDVVLPGRGGRLVYEALRERYPQMRFLFVSGFSPAAAQLGEILDQGLEYLQKPVPPAALLRAVRRILDQRP